MIQIEQLHDMECPECGHAENIDVSFKASGTLKRSPEGKVYIGDSWETGDRVYIGESWDIEVDTTCQAHCRSCDHSEALARFSANVARQEAEDACWRDRAVETCQDVGIDADAVVSRGEDDGAYVQAWVWVPEWRVEYLDDDAGEEIDPASETFVAFESLEEDVKNTVRDRYMENVLPGYKETFLYDRLIETAGLLNIEIDNISAESFSHTLSVVYGVFHYEHDERSQQRLRAHRPGDRVLHAIADALARIQGPYEGMLKASMEIPLGNGGAGNERFNVWCKNKAYSRARPEHYRNTNFVPYKDEAHAEPNHTDHAAAVGIRAQLKAFAQWLYSDFQNGLDEEIKASKHVFDKNGRMAIRADKYPAATVQAD